MVSFLGSLNSPQVLKDYEKIFARHAFFRWCAWQLSVINQSISVLLKDF